jgi:hypothetical protein
MGARIGLLDRWSRPLEEKEDLVWRNLLRLYAHNGRAPRVDEIASETGLSSDGVEVALRELESHDLVGLDGISSQIRMAYPFAETATGHRVELNGQVLHALCAIDALGVAAMYGKDTNVSSQCYHCGKAINVATRAEGLSLATVTPSGAVVWYDFAYDGCAASSSCPSITFFCCADHLEQWRTLQTPHNSGAQLTMDEAFEVGRAIFGPVLIEPKRRGSSAETS